MEAFAASNIGRAGVRRGHWHQPANSDNQQMQGEESKFEEIPCRRPVQTQFPRTYTSNKSRSCLAQASDLRIGSMGRVRWKCLRKLFISSNFRQIIRSFTPPSQYFSFKSFSSSRFFSHRSSLVEKLTIKSTWLLSNVDSLTSLLCKSLTECS